MSRQSRAVIVRSADRTPEVELVRVPSPGPGEVIVRMQAATLCVTDEFAMTGVGPIPMPILLGHGGVGVVDEVGPESTRLRVGDQVALVGSSQCGRCYFCLHGSPSGCVDIGAGMFPPRRVAADAEGAGIFADGGVGALGEFVLQRESNLAAVDYALPAAHAAMLGCGIMSGLGAVLEVAKVQPGDIVSISGCGHLGLWMIQAARFAGAAEVIAIDPLAARRAAAVDLGATLALDATPDIVERVRQHTHGRGVDVAIEAAGSAVAMEQAVAMSRTGATVVLTGMDDIAASVTIPNFEVSIGARKILGSQTGGGDFLTNIPRFAQLIADGPFAPDEIAVEFRLDQISEAIAAMRQRSVLTPVVMFESAA